MFGVISVNIEDKVCACYSISNLCSDEEARKAIMQRKLVRVCGPFILETEPNLVEAALGCLYSLSCQGEDSVAHLVEQDVLTPLLTLVLQFRNPGNVYNKVKAQTCKSLIRLSASCPVEVAGGGQLHVHCSLFTVHLSI